MGGDDQTLVDSAEQTHVTSAEQENDSVDNAQNVEDNSSRSENLQGLSNVMQGKGSNDAEMCEKFYPLQKRNLLNSAFVGFLTRSFETSYNLQADDAVFKNFQLPFDVKYTPSEHKLNIEMPVKFMGATDLHSVYSKIPSGQMSEDLTDDNKAGNFKDMYEKGVHRAWSGQFQFYLDAKNLVSNALCYDWSFVNSVYVDVSVRDVDHPQTVMSHSNTSNYYKIYYYRAPSDFRDVTFIDWVIFSERTRAREEDESQHYRQNVFAHEFGHQLGFADEYPVDYIKDDIRGEEKCVYYNTYLKAYERTESDREYTLPREMFNHGGKDYYAEENVFVVDGKEKNGVVLINGIFEMKRPLDGLQSPDPVSAVDINGRRHRTVYLFDDGKQEVVLKAREKAGVREYDLEYLSVNRTNGARIYHNGKKYSVGKISKRNRDNSEKVYYYLVNEDGSVKKDYLDGMYTSHTEMAKREFGEEYANKNATMYDESEHNSQGLANNTQGLENNVMNGGNIFKPHYYIPFKRGMVKAIKFDSNGMGYGSGPTYKAPNMEEDWKIV